METAIAIKEPEVLSVADVKKYIAPNATDKELFMFMGICKSYGLNPLKREIHFVKYGSSAASIIVGYESYIKRAERTGKLDGWKCWIEKDEIGEKAIIEIKRKDQSIPIRWEVYRKEFDKGQSTWKTMPMFMLKKVAIAQGFRLAFSEEVGGMPYIPEELPTTAHVASESLTKTEVDTTSEPDVPDFTPDVTPQRYEEPPMPEPQYEVGVEQPPENADNGIHMIKVVSVKVKKEGISKAGKPWTLYEIQSATGKKYSTFSNSISSRLREGIEDGSLVPMKVKGEKYGVYEIEKIMSADE